MTLLEYISSNEISYGAFSKIIGVKPPTVRRYCLGERIPKPSVMERIKSATNGAVTPNDFYTEASR